MSIIIGGGMLLSYDETEVTCPICTAVWDASAKIEKAKYPVFNTRCKMCKGKITISISSVGALTCFETDCPKTVKRLETVTPNKVNGRVIRKKPDDDDLEEAEMPELV